MGSYTVILVQNWKFFFKFDSLYRLKYLHESRVFYVVSCKTEYIGTYYDVKYRVFQKDLNIFYSGHRGHRT